MTSATQSQLATAKCDSGFQPMELSEIEAIATSHGCEVVIASPSQLQFDLDSPETLQDFEWFYACKLIKAWPSATREEWKSKSGNTHIVVTLPEELDFPERIALQAMGGSDPGREFAAWNCWKAGSAHPVLLFKPLNTAGGAL